MLELFGEVGGDIPKFFSLGNFFLINDAVKSSSKNFTAGV